MKLTESLEEFYNRTAFSADQIFSKQHGYFNIFEREAFCKAATSYRRRDFYKISLIIGSGMLYYADKVININHPALVFSNPMIPYSFDLSSEVQRGYFCLFSEDFIDIYDMDQTIQDSPLYKPGGNPVFFLNTRQQNYVIGIFQQMQQEMQSNYANKFDLLHNYVNILIHEALKMIPADTYYQPDNGASRITSLFLELLERQFPIEAKHNGLRLKSPAEYANHLSVHVNHLNRSLKEITGKTTSDHISDRLIKESKLLLLHTKNTVSEIGYVLGFENPAYFNHFFRKHTGYTPGTFRHLD